LIEQRILCTAEVLYIFSFEHVGSTLRPLINWTGDIMLKLTSGTTPGIDEDSTMKKTRQAEPRTLAVSVQFLLTTHKHLLYITVYLRRQMDYDWH
jgi:hypothetical protein